MFQALPASEVQCHYLQTQVAALCKQDPDPLASVPTEELALGLPAALYYAGIQQSTI